MATIGEQSRSSLSPTPEKPKTTSAPGHYAAGSLSTTLDHTQRNRLAHYSWIEEATRDHHHAQTDNRPQMTSPRVPPGEHKLIVLELDSRLATMSRKAILNHLDELQPIIDAYLGTNAPDQHDWIGQQPKTQQDSLQWLMDINMQLTTTAWYSVKDHAETLAHLLDEGPPHIWSYGTLARAVVEAATTYCYLSDLTKPTPLRLIRTAAQYMAGRQEDYKLRTHPNPLADQGHHHALEEFNDHLTKAGIEPLLNKKSQPIGYQRDGHSAQLNWSVTGESEKWHEHYKAPYRLTSAITHSAWWMLAHSMFKEDNWMGVKINPDNLATAVALTLDSMTGMARASGKGHQDDAVTKLRTKTTLRIKSIQDRADGSTSDMP